MQAKCTYTYNLKVGNHSITDSVRHYALRLSALKNNALSEYRDISEKWGGKLTPTSLNCCLTGLEHGRNYLNMLNISWSMYKSTAF